MVVELPLQIVVLVAEAVGLGGGVQTIVWQSTIFVGVKLATTGTKLDFVEPL